MEDRWSEGGSSVNRLVLVRECKGRDKLESKKVKSSGLGDSGAEKDKRI